MVAGTLVLVIWCMTEQQFQLYRGYGGACRYSGITNQFGEDTEFHIFIIDGQMFEKKLKIVDSKKILKDGYWFLDILKCRTEEK